MSNNQDTYRPRSPDLSAFAPPPLPGRLPSFHSVSGLPTDYPSYQHRGSYDASPFFSPATTTPSASYFGVHLQSDPQPLTTTQLQRQDSRAFSQPEPFTARFPTPSQRIPPAFSSPASQPQPHDTFFNPFEIKQSFQSPTAPLLDMPRPRRVKSSVDYNESDDVSYDSDSVAPPRTSKKRKSNPEPEMPMPMPAGSGEPQAIEVKTKFPVARIKRIMQADEDVGKVAQATPTAVSKALELFMITLVQKGVAEARSKNSKKVSAAHLKAALKKDGQFDFLDQICETVQDHGERKAGGARAKSEDDSSEEAGGAGGTGAKKGKARGKRKVSKMDEDTD